MIKMMQVFAVIGVYAAQLSAGYDPASIPALPAPSQSTRVSTVTDLFTAVGNAKAGETIVLADGDYYLTSSLRITTAGVALRGASDDPKKAVLHGKGFGTADINEELIKIEATDITIACLTIRDVRANGLKIQTGANHNLLVHNVRFIDICERSIKGPGVEVSNNGEVRYCYFEQVTPITAAIPNLYASGDYIAGMDMMKIDGWRIHDNVFKNIRGMNGGGRAAIFLWNGCRNCTIERNTIVGCDRGIAFGNALNAENRNHCIKCIARNNFIASDKYDAGIEVAGVDSISILNNSIWKQDETGSRGIRFITSFGNVALRNNLLQGRLLYDNGDTGVTAANNLVGGLSGYFVNPAAGDLHLLPAAVNALNRGTPDALVTDDWDGQTRISPPDIGADEYGHAVPVQAAFGSTSSATRLTKSNNYAGMVYSLQGRLLRGKAKQAAGVTIRRSGL